MEGEEYGEPDLEHMRERIESKLDEFEGGPEPGWDRMEEAVEESRGGLGSQDAEPGRPARAEDSTGA